MMYKRIIDIKAQVQRKSVFLFGPRQTGKSFYLKKTFKNALYYDLLKTDVYFRFSSKPSLLREELVSINIHFILTGSSARKLKYGAANLLGGRALTKNLYPLVSKEIQAEGLVRKLGHFSKFLNLAALCDTEMLNFSNVGSNLGLPAKTVREYFRILEDTLIGSLLEPYTKTVKRKAIYFIFLILVSPMCWQG